MITNLDFVVVMPGSFQSLVLVLAKAYDGFGNPG